MGGGDKRGALRIALQALAEDARRRVGDHDVAPAGRRERRLARAGRGLRGGGAARRGGVRGGRGPRAAGDLAARVRARAGESRARDRAQPEDPQASTRNDPQAVAALERLYIATGPLRGPARASTTRSSSMAKTRPRSWRSASSSPRSTRRRSSSRTRRSSSISRSSPRIREQLQALRGARSPVPAARAAGRSWRDDHPGSSICADRRHGRDRRAEVPARRGPGTVPGRRRGRGRVVPRGARDRFVARRRAHRAAGVPVEQRR